MTESNDVLLSEASAVSAAPADGETIRLAQENQRLCAENRRLRQNERRREVNLFLSELRESGQLTPAMEQAGIEEALLAAEEHGPGVVFADGRNAPMAAVLRMLLKSLPVLGSQEDYSASFAAPLAQPTPLLSAEEERIAAQLGLSAAEFAALREE